MRKRMPDKEMIRLLIKVINRHMAREIELLKRMKFEDLSTEEQSKVIMSEVFEKVKG